MRLLNARIIGFQSFADSGVVNFGAGINLLVGQNNSGKSAFLRALQPVLPDDRHRNPERYLAHSLPLPDVRLSIEMSGRELFENFLRAGMQIHFPVKAPDVDVAKAEVEAIFVAPKLSFEISRRSGGRFSYIGVPWHQSIYAAEPGYTLVAAPQDGVFTVIQVQGGVSDNLYELVERAWERDMFFFSAERLAIGQSSFGHVERLDSNAANLPAVLHTLSGSRGTVFLKLVEHLREIFPTVGNLSVRPSPVHNNVNEVLVWPTTDMSRVELSFPLSQSGTGVAQAIALLTAIMTAERAVIIIDEINSFLHPAAVKALLRIIQSQYSNHQYVISTHAPEVISFSNAQTIHLISRTGYDSHVKQLNLGEIDTFREVAAHLGVSMSDVFAADRVVWVEGPTEELCFPYIYNVFYGGVPRGMLITAVAATGDFNRSRDPQTVYEIYSRLSAAVASLVVTVAFSFDSEKLSEVQKEKMRKASGGLLHFLPRRHMECYLIDPDAIAAFILSMDVGSSVDRDMVASQLRTEAAARDLTVLPKWDGNLENEDWLSLVDAATLIDRVCKSLSQQRAFFSKKNDSLKLLQYILADNRERVEPLAEYVRTLIGDPG